jgi:uncharacterized protein (UPF0332 family)
LNAVRAILILEGSNPERHEGAVTLLSLKFIRQGVLPTEIVKKFKVLLSRRTDVDYGDFDTIDERESEDSLNVAEEIIQVIDKARERLLNELK